jgi:hypothetical protein
MKNAENRVALYILAGVATSENFMDDFKHELELRYEHAGIEVHSSMLFPYGDWNRSIVKQVMEISYDLMPRLRDNNSYFRGQTVADHIKQSNSNGRIVIVGHSSGGVAGVHAANQLDRVHYPDVRVVQIGSPKCAVPIMQRASTLFIRAINQKGKSADPITRLGSWGGWEKSGRIVRWNAQSKAPSSIYAVPIIGGHADYFRNKDPFRDVNGVTNLKKITDCIWQWLLLISK